MIRFTYNFQINSYPKMGVEKDKVEQIDGYQEVTRETETAPTEET